MTKSIYQSPTSRPYHHHHHHQYPVGAAMNGIGRYTSAQMNSMSNMVAAAAANSPYNSMAAQFTGMPNANAPMPPVMNFQDHMLHYQSY
jgi:hypothetical protein